MIIKLTKGKETIIDDEDWEKVKKYSWCLSSWGYAKSGSGGKTTYLHRLLTDFPQGMEVDHINGDRLDNRKINLRICTRAQNQRNRSKCVGISKYKGVCWITKFRKWKSTITNDGKIYHLGLFDNEIDAAMAYNNRAIELFGEFAWINKL